MLSGPRKSVTRIAADSHVNRASAVARYLDWQRRRALNAFPFEQTLSASRVIAHGPSGVSALIHVHGAYDHNNMSFLRILLAPGLTFWDVGANIGSYTLIASQVSDATIVAFEPHPAMFEQLRANVELNDRANVQLEMVAISDRTGALGFTDNASSSSVNRLTSDANAALRVAAMRADDMIATGRAPRPDVLKIDVEGHEAGVLRGLGPALKDVKVVFAEDNAASRADVCRQLTAHGFIGPYCVDVTGRTLRATPSRYEDPVWIAAGFVDQLTRSGYAISGT
ncbi:MAG: FkbM family methyltransferase [Solirubrobacteraceae bacterium]